MKKKPKYFNPALNIHHSQTQTYLDTFIFTPCFSVKIFYPRYPISKSNLLLTPKCSIQALITHLVLHRTSFYFNLIHWLNKVHLKFIFMILESIIHSHNTISCFREPMGYSIQTKNFGMNQGIWVPICSGSIRYAFLVKWFLGLHLKKNLTLILILYILTKYKFS